MTGGPASPKLVYVGNDVVDLRRDRTSGKADDERFVRRVYDREEQECIRASEDPDFELWCLWAAKEAGFKAISKLMDRPMPFAHRRFVVRWELDAARAGAGTHDRVRAGTVRHGERDVVVSVSLLPDGEGLHAVAYSDAGVGSEAPVSRVRRLDDPSGAWHATLDDLRGRMTPRERDGVHTLESAAVRIALRKELGELLDVEETRVEVVTEWDNGGRRPCVLVDGERASVDVSLSHDGRWIAWAIWARSVHLSVGKDPR